MEYWQYLRQKVGHDKIILNCAGGAIFNEKGQVLLQKRSGSGLWGFPSGMMELGESLEETAVREIFEETGLEVKVMRLIEVYSKYSDEYANGDKSKPIAALFECRVVGGKPISSNDETLELEYFDLNSPPPMYNRQHEDMLADVRAYKNSLGK